MGTRDEAQAIQALVQISRRLGIDFSGVIASGKAREMLDALVQLVRTNLPSLEAVGPSADTCRLIGTERKRAEAEESIVNGEVDRFPSHDTPLA